MPFSTVGKAHHGYVWGVEDLCAVRECDGPQLWRRVKDLAPPLGQVDPRTILHPHQVHDPHRPILGLEHIVNPLTILINNLGLDLKT